MANSMDSDGAASKFKNIRMMFESENCLKLYMSRYTIEVYSISPACILKFDKLSAALCRELEICG